VWKLYWEIVRLEHATPYDVIDMKCFAFNAAITAWQLTDWVYSDMTEAQRDRHSAKSLKAFQRAVRDQCRAIHLYRQIATASKHREVSLYLDKSVSAGVSFVQPSDGNRFGAWEVFIADGSNIRPALDVLEEARLYWFKFVSDLGWID
jgi:hypothetical protein